MDKYVESIRRFVAQLNKSVDFIEGSKLTGIYTFYSSHSCIYIYLPGTSRLHNHPNLKTIHIDIDIIQHSSQKLLNRIVGLHGCGQKIFARQTVVARIDKKMALGFLDEHHLQTPLPGKYRYGLFQNGELVSIAVFGGARLMRQVAEGHRSFELLRFCHKGSTLVVGGLSKLIKAFINDFNPQDIMTYADLDWTEESSLGCVGFQAIGKLSPQIFYLVNGIRQKGVPEIGETHHILRNRGSLKLKLIL